MLNLIASTIDPQIAFETAISASILSDDPKATNYAGKYMFMGETSDGKLAFKNRETRQYVTAELC